MGIPRGHAVKTSASSWTPANLSDLTLWIQPSTILKTGTNLTSWPDSSPAANNFTVLEGTPQVGVFTNGLNGVSFVAASSQSLGGPTTINVFPTDNEFHGFMVCQQNGNGGIDITSPGYFHNPPYIADQGNSLMVGQITVVIGALDSVEIGARAGSATRFSTQNNASNTRSVPQCLEFWFTGANVLHIRVAGGADVTVTMDDALNQATFTDFFIARSTSGGYLSMTMGEMFIVSSAPSAGDLVNAKAYITAKWGVAA